MQSVFGLEGKRILVLGAGQGIGEATCRLLTSLGAEVAVVDKELDRAERVAADLTATGARALPFAVDVVDDDALVATIAQVGRELGPIDGLATIIGMAAWAPLVDMTLETWDAEQKRNLRYFFLAAREVARSLMERGAPGSIVGVASVDGIRSAPGHGAYGAAKAGLVNLVKTMAIEWSGAGIRANLVAPGATITPRIPHSGDENEAIMMTNVPMKRRGLPQDMAKAITFFLSDLSPYVTGQTLAVDGGFLAANLFNTGTRTVPVGGVIGDAKA
jgi:NAD(P)-dependent dehydrogenase (short-subunit alcohol dehydrogenase family)